MIATQGSIERLYDASAIFNILFHGDSQPDLFAGQAVLDLTKYELGNAVSKYAKDDKDDMLLLFCRCMNIVHHMRVLSIGGTERDVLATASSTGLTFYDSAYVVAAERHGLVLVTDDAEMSEVARSRGIATITSAEV